MPWSNGFVVVLSSFHWTIALDDECKDPLFHTHWYGKTDIAALNSIPTVETTLSLCPQFNFHQTCCSVPFESEQAKYFNFFKNVIFIAKLARVSVHRLSVVDVRNTAVYSVAEHTEKEQFNLALERFNPVLHPTMHTECFSALLTYTAGMNCFACRPDWFEFVTLEHGMVVRVHVQPSVCMQLWSSCEAFGRATANLKQALLDSALAKQAKRQAENLDMFFDQQALCTWLHNEIALHPFQRPSEVDREAAPEDAGGPSTTATFPPTDAADTVRRLQQQDGDREVDIYELGQRSGFDRSWPAESSSSCRFVGNRCAFGLAAAFLASRASARAVAV